LRINQQTRKKNMRANRLVTLLSTALIVAPLSAWAEPEQLVITPFVGIQKFDADRHVGANDSNGIFGLGAEYRFSDHWGAELNYTRAYNNMDIRPGENNVGYDRLAVDALYHFSNSSAVEPYLRVGAGHDRYNYSSGPTDQNTDIDAGVGARFRVTDNFSIQPEVKAVHELDTSQTHSLVTVGFNLALGGTTKPAAPVAAAVIAPPPAPPAPLDSDGDGVIDANDKCPNTPRGREVDANGCEFALHKTEQIRLDINFATDKAEITEAYAGEVEKAAKFLKHYANVNAEIAGYTDATGSHAHNAKLSQRRADAVRDMLITRYSIDAARLTAAGYAETNPIASNTTAAGRAQNRRVIAVMKADVVEKR
jgi:OOP family OmpA-OmpF porin